MKKIFWSFALFAALIFVVSCGSSNKDNKENGNNNQPSAGICEYGEYECHDGDSYFCGYSGDDLMWLPSELCGEDGCNSETGKCYDESTDPTDPTNTCKIDDSFETSNYESYVLINGYGTLQTSGEAETADMLKASFYDEAYPNVSFNAGTYLMAAELNNGKKAIVTDSIYQGLVDSNSAAIAYGVEAQVILTEDDLAEVESGEIADFGPAITYINEMTYVLGEDYKINMVKTCTVGMSAGSTSTEGRFQYCMDDDTIEAGKKIKLGIDAAVIIAPEEKGCIRREKL